MHRSSQLPTQPPPRSLEPDAWDPFVPGFATVAAIIRVAGDALEAGRDARCDGVTLSEWRHASGVSSTVAAVSLAEALLLVVARRSRSRGAPSIERAALLEAAGAEHDPELDGPLEALEQSLDALVARGALSRTGTAVSITPEAASAVATIDRERMSRSFGAWMLRCEASPAWVELCRRSTRLPFVHFGTIDEAQWGALLAALAAGPGSRVVDLGCGLGTVAEHVSDATGAHVTGIDFAPRAIARASERTRAKADRLAFRTGDLDRLDLEPGAFDVALAVDTLYFVDDLARTVEDVRRALAPGGRFVAFYDAMRRPGDASGVLEPAGSRLGSALAAAGFAFSATDFTERERAFWAVQREATAELKAAWEREGNAHLWRSADREAQAMSERHEAGTVRRHLYVATR